MTRTLNGLSTGESASLSLLLVAANDLSDSQRDLFLYPDSVVQITHMQLNQTGQPVQSQQLATWDHTKGMFVVPLGSIVASGASSGAGNYDTYPHHHNVYNRHHISVSHTAAEAIAIPLMLDGPVNATFSITSGVGVFRDANLEPMGIPVQLSKNWHIRAIGQTTITYTMPTMPPGVHEMEFTIASSKWGETYAASHAQLGLVGWGTNQQWMNPLWVPGEIHHL